MRFSRSLALAFTLVSACGRVGIDLEDARADTRVDSGTDVRGDAPTESGSLDVGVDTGIDSGVDSGIDTGSDSGVDAGIDTGIDTGPPDSGDPLPGSPCDSDAGTFVPRCVGRDVRVCMDGLVTDLPCQSCSAGACVDFRPSFVGPLVGVFDRGSADLDASRFAAHSAWVVNSDTGAIDSYTLQPRVGGTGPPIRPIGALGVEANGIWFQNNVPNPGHPDGTQIALFAFRTLHVPGSASITFVGSRPVVMLARVGMIIEGLLDVGAVLGEPGAGGFRGRPPNQTGHSTILMNGGVGGRVSPMPGATWFNGAGGGGFGSYGGAGGNSDMLGAFGSSGGMPVGDSTMVPFHGGGGGGGGGTSETVLSTSAGYGGSGGGALALIARHYIDFEYTGVINAGGQGGNGGVQSAADSGGSGGGGGAGGAVVLEAPVVRARLSSSLGGIFANGGGGGGASTSTASGSNGENARAVVTRAPGGLGAPNTGAGGRGSDQSATDSVYAMRGGTGMPMTSAGGGGGGAGRILIRTRDALPCAPPDAGVPFIQLSPRAGLEGTLDPAPTVCTTLP